MGAFMKSGLSFVWVAKLCNEIKAFMCLLVRTSGGYDAASLVAVSTAAIEREALSFSFLCEPLGWGS